MPTLRELSTWIREYGQDPRHQSRLLVNEFLWNQLWTAMDVIEDTDSALTAYQENEFPTRSRGKISSNLRCHAGAIPAAGRSRRPDKSNPSE
jgi:hypothetical protein